MSEHLASGSASPSATPPRRGFLIKAVSVVIGGAVSLVPLVSGLLFFLSPLHWGLDPMRRRKAAGKSAGDDGGKEGFIKIGTVDSVPANGEPTKFTVIADRHDAWNTFLKVPIGAVYVRKDEKGEFVAYNVTCPHLGCAVDYLPAAQKFLCPCHDSSFSLDGKRSNETPPRDMDTLELDTDKIKQGELWVKYQNFRTGEAHKVVKS